MSVCLFVHRKQGLFQLVHVDDIQMTGRKHNMAPMWKKLMKHVDLDEPTSFLDHVFLGCTQRECERRIYFSRSNLEMTFVVKIYRKKVAWSYDMEGHAQKCVERSCELANKKTEQLYKVSTLCLDDHHFKKEELESVGELSQVCSQIVLKCMYLARIGRPEILVPRLRFSNQLRSGILCIFGSRTCVPMSWMCKKQTSVSNSSAAFEIISLDAGLRMDGLLALDFWDIVVEV